MAVPAFGLRGVLVGLRYDRHLVLLHAAGPVERYSDLIIVLGSVHDTDNRAGERDRCRLIILSARSRMRLEVGLLRLERRNRVGTDARIVILCHKADLLADQGLVISLESQFIGVVRGDGEYARRIAAADIPAASTVFLMIPLVSYATTCWVRSF